MDKKQNLPQAITFLLRTFATIFVKGLVTGVKDNSPYAHYIDSTYGVSLIDPYFKDIEQKFIDANDITPKAVSAYFIQILHYCFNLLIEFPPAYQGNKDIDTITGMLWGGTK